jgi:uncharacterized RDD family membrane protein YckC
MNAIVPSLSIRTPEGIAFNLLLAGVMPRFLAWLIDVAAISAIIAVASKIISLAGVFGESIHGALGTILYFVVSIGYGIFFEWTWRGQTPGKRVFRLRVLDLHALRLQLSQIVIRNVLRAVDCLPAFYVVGGLACFISKRSQRLGDLAANTIVVRYPKITAPEIEQILTNKYNSLRDYPHLEARLRQTVTPGEAAIAFEALRRSKILAAQERISLFEELATYFKQLVEFPPEAIELVPAEQYVRNVVEIIYRPMAERP